MPYSPMLGLCMENIGPQVMAVTRPGGLIFSQYITHTWLIRSMYSPYWDKNISGLMSKKAKREMSNNRKQKSFFSFEFGMQISRDDIFISSYGIRIHSFLVCPDPCNRVHFLLGYE